MDDSEQKFSSSSTSNYIQNSNNTIKSISLNFLNNNNYNKNESKLLESDRDLNEKIIKLLIGDHPLLPMKAIKKIAHCNFMNQHYKTKDYYNIKVIDEIIHNENSHIVAEFKDYLIKGDISEFLQQYYKKKESLDLLPKIYEYYITCSVIFPNYVILPESQYIYKNIQRKQRVIDIQQEQEDKEENIKKGLINQEKEPTIFNTQAFDSILNQTDTSGIKQYFGISRDASKIGGENEMMKLLNNIESAEKKGNINRNKKQKINVCTLKKGNSKDIFQYKKNLLLNDGGCNKKIHICFNNKENGTGHLERKNSGGNNNNELNKKHYWNKNNLKQILRQCTENNNNNLSKKKNNFSTQITYIDSCNKYIKHFFDLKGIESIKKIKKNSKNIIKDNKNENEKDTVKTLFKNNSQSYGSLKNANSKEKNKENFFIKDNKSKDKDKEKEKFRPYNLINKNNISGNESINQSYNKKAKNDKKNQSRHKENNSRNNDMFNIDNNIKTFFREPSKNLTQNKNGITSYKTKSQNKLKPKGYQTSRNKYDNKNMYINISKSNLSRNHQSIDSELNNNHHIIKKTINKMKNKHNNIKNNLINALLGTGDNSKKKKNSKYKEKLMNKIKDNESLVDSIDLKNININSNNINFDLNTNNNENIGNNENDNNNNNNENQQGFKDYGKIFFYNGNEQNNHQSKKILSSSNLDSNNKISSSSCTKTMSVNSYGAKPNNNNYSSNVNKKQISTSKIPLSNTDNKVSSNNNNNKCKKSSNNKLVEDSDNKNKLREYIDNYLDDYFSSKINDKTKIKTFNIEDCNNHNNNNYYIESKNKSKNEKFSSAKNFQEKMKEKDGNVKIRNSIFNFEKRISKKYSEKNFNIIDKVKTKSSPKKGSTKKIVRTNKSGNMQSCEHGPLSARESNKYQMNAEIIELLSNKIQKIKLSIKENSDKGSNSISSIFKKKKNSIGWQDAPGLQHEKK